MLLEDILYNGDEYVVASLDKAGDFTAMFDISTNNNTTHEVIRFCCKTTAFVCMFIR